MKGWRIKKDDRLRGAYGETNYDKKLIRINKKKHRSTNTKLKRYTPNKDGSENLLMTIVHEVNHVVHPNMKERGIEKLAKAMKARMSDKQKAKYYNLIA